MSKRITSALWLTAGVSEEVLALADGCALVPMLGFVDSYNVSVAAALTLYEVCACMIPSVTISDHIVSVSRQQMDRPVMHAHWRATAV